MAGSLAVSVVITEPDGPRVLAVRRPEEPGEEFGGMWGLPAATVAPGETPEDAVRRLGRYKLGLDLEPGSQLAQGFQPRPSGRLEMRLFSARALTWPPALRTDGPADVTYYTGWQWAEPDFLVPTAERGSLCCQLYLATVPGHAISGGQPSG